VQSLLYVSAAPRAAAEMGHRWFEDCRYVLKAFAQGVGLQRGAADLLPDDFDRFRQRLLRRGFASNGKGLVFPCWLACRNLPVSADF